jgi:hypothetical protein
MISGAIFIAGGGRLPDGWDCGAAGCGFSRTWGGEAVTFFAGTSPASNAWRSTLFGRADESGGVSLVAGGGMVWLSFTSPTVGDLSVSLLVMDERSFVVVWMGGALWVSVVSYCRVAVGEREATGDRAFMGDRGGWSTGCGAVSTYPGSWTGSFDA